MLLTDEEMDKAYIIPDRTQGYVFHLRQAIRDAQLKKVVGWILEHKEIGLNKHGNVYIPPKEFDALLEEIK